MVFWDVDHTLIDNGGVSKEIYADAFARLAGRPPMHPARTEGRTDRRIIAGMFQDHGMEAPPWSEADQALQAAGRGREADLQRRGRVLPGVTLALRAVAEEPALISSVLTGNIAANARVKLGAFELDSLLDMEVGAFGADSDDRADLVDIARSRVAAVRGLPLRTPVVLIGDTPRDVEAALDSGVHVVAVASGIHGAAELRAAGAGLVLPDLCDIEFLLTHLRALAKP
ncbi:Phosphoglycolate phosphatase, HAD superfamily [Streptomyces aidingensis]|uniref:Phosphoglycolate phosphatase, HAD superfamily n=2 Tax=Streptomyces aidingensis TaxID=910347 RepID=A0A1I1KLM0_9ACTN|nr:Phosphoglycolate phosphatase, HAD superfamily [Streptomyces aidingensis]